MTGTAVQSTKVHSGSHVRHVPTSQVEFGQLLPDFYMFDRQSLPGLPKQLDHTKTGVKHGAWTLPLVKKRSCLNRFLGTEATYKVSPKSLAKLVYYFLG